MKVQVIVAIQLFCTDESSLVIVMYRFGLILANILLNKKEYANEFILSQKNN